MGPGLSMCLRVGVVKAQDLCHEHGLPIVPVHHMEAHALVARVGDGATANESNADAADADADVDDDVDDALVRAPFPFLALLVSGGHNQLILARAVGEYRVLGGALDDALGEAYDKTARLLGLDVGGGGGPALEALARRGDPKAYRFPVPLRRRKDCDFSYAGLKTAVRLAIERDLGKPADGDAFARARGLSDGNDASAGDAEDPSFSAEETARRDAVRADIAASFQAAAVKHLEERTRRAIAWARESLANDTKAEPSGGNLSCVVVAGGVAANATVRATLGAVASEAGLPLVLPPPRWRPGRSGRTRWRTEWSVCSGRVRGPPPRMTTGPPPRRSPRSARARAPRETTSPARRACVWSAACCGRFRACGSPPRARARASAAGTGARRRRCGSTRIRRRGGWTRTCRRTSSPCGTSTRFARSRARRPRSPRWYRPSRPPPRASQ